MGRAYSTVREKSNACGILVRKPERMRPLGRRRWVDSINIDLIKDGIWYGLDRSGSG
jgi:hypothetical protein